MARSVPAAPTGFEPLRLTGLYRSTLRRLSLPIVAHAMHAVPISFSVRLARWMRNARPAWSAPQPSLDLASFTIEIRAARTSSGVLTGLANAKRTGRGPCGVIADISKPYLSTPVMLAEVISVAFEKALQ